MGHVRLGVLPKTQKWNRVVDALQVGGDVETIAELSAEAAERALKTASHDPAFLHAFWLLTQIPLAARGPNFVGDLRQLGVRVSDNPGLMDVVAAISDAVDRYSREQGGKTDLGEMAQMSAVESLAAQVGPSLPSLFGPTAEEVQRAIGRLASGDRFSALAREFYARLTQRTLGYYLSRELNRHIGIGERFETDANRAVFDQALAQHCRESSRIVEAFAGGWYGKNVYQGDGLTQDDIKNFAPIAFRKICAELGKRRDASE